MIGNFIEEYLSRRLGRQQQADSQEASLAQELERRRMEHEARQKEFNPNFQGFFGGGGGRVRDDLNTLVGRAGSGVADLRDPRLQAIELMKDAYKSAYGVDSQRSGDERHAASEQRALLRRMLEGDGSLASNQSRGPISFGGGGRARSGIDSSALGAIESLKNRARSEEAYQLMQQRGELDLEAQRNTLKGQKYETNRKPLMDSWKRNLIMHLLRGAM